MPPRKNSIGRRGGLEPNAEAWLRGENIGFFMWKGQDELAALWAAYGDETRYRWERGMRLPEFILEDSS